jgi:hypothetical protein
MEGRAMLTDEAISGVRKAAAVDVASAALLLSIMSIVKSVHSEELKNEGVLGTAGKSRRSQDSETRR